MNLPVIRNSCYWTITKYPDKKTWSDGLQNTSASPWNSNVYEVFELHDSEFCKNHTGCSIFDDKRTIGKRKPNQMQEPVELSRIGKIGGGYFTNVT